MPGPPVNAPRVYLLEFGFEKTWVNADSRKTLNDLLDAWKCRFVNIDVAGHTDTKEADNLNLSELRAVAVQTYLVGAGVVPSRITTKIAGERGLQVPTPEGVRLRSNRVVVLTIHSHVRLCQMQASEVVASEQALVLGSAGQGRRRGR